MEILVMYTYRYFAVGFTVLERIVTKTRINDTIPKEVIVRLEKVKTKYKRVLFGSMLTVFKIINNVWVLVDRKYSCCVVVPNKYWWTIIGPLLIVRRPKSEKFV